MKTELKLNIPESLTFAGVAAAAALNHQVALDLGQNTNTKIVADRTALLNSRNAYEDAKQELATREALVDSIMAAGRQFLMNGRDNLKPYLGNEANKNWEVTGMVGSIAVPDQPLLLHPLLDSYCNYYSTHPEREIVALNLTATRATDLSTQLMTALAAVSEQETEVTRLKGVRDAKADKLLRRLRGLRDELAQILDPLDPLWMAFGFNRPGADETPDVPTNISAILIGPTAASVKWEASARAEYYRVWTKIHGSEGDYVTVGSPADLDFTIENLPANSTIDIVVTAVNNGGESAVSEKITVTTH